MCLLRKSCQKWKPKKHWSDYCELFSVTIGEAFL